VVLAGENDDVIGDHRLTFQRFTRPDQVMGQHLARQHGQGVATDGRHTRHDLLLSGSPAITGPDRQYAPMHDWLTRCRHALI